MAEDRTHLSTREVEHAAARRILDERTTGPLGDERHPVRAVPDEVALSSGVRFGVGHRAIIACRFTLWRVDGAALVESAQVAFAEGDVVGAVARLREAVAIRPNPSAREQLAGLLFFEDDLVGARHELELAFREWRSLG